MEKGGIGGTEEVIKVGSHGLGEREVELTRWDTEVGF